MSRQKACLIVIFNHRYDGNIPKLERIYRDRFEAIFFLVPFYTGTQSNVLGIYESSAYFQGFFAQAYERLVSGEFTHYVFAGDDLLINPRLDDSNLAGELRLDDESAYIKEIVPLAGQTFQWSHKIRSLEAVTSPRMKREVAYEAELPPPEVAARRFDHHGIAVADVPWRSLRGYTGSCRYDGGLRSSIFLLNHKIRKPALYPLAFGYSDFVVVPQKAMSEFCRLCGVFAAINLFVEVAIPTALLLACGRVVVEKDLAPTWQGVELWDEAEVEALRRELFPLLYLPAHVTFRFTDILRGLVAQPLMWLAGFHLGFTSATVEQLRNPHDFLTDFASEMPCYLYPERIIEIVGGVARSSASLADNLMTAYRALHEAAIVTQDELVTLEAWLKDVT